MNIAESIKVDAGVGVGSDGSGGVGSGGNCVILGGSKGRRGDGRSGGGGDRGSSGDGGSDGGTRLKYLTINRGGVKQKKYNTLQRDKKDKMTRSYCSSFYSRDYRRLKLF